jgi:hypothetical protein
MRRLAGGAVLALMLVAAAAPATVSASPMPRSAATTARPAATLVALRSRYGFGARSRGYGSYGRPRHSFLRRLVKTAIWLYVLHLFFTHGGLSIVLWVIIIALVIAMLRLRRRRRVAF